MYLARKEINGETHYFIRETYRENNDLKSRTLYELGSDPAQYVRYPGGNSYYISGQIELTIVSKGIEVDSFELEELFWPFLDQKLKRTIERYGGPKPGRHIHRFQSYQEMMELQSRIHILDKRRLHFLKFGLIYQKDIESVPYRFYNRLLDKSRDEIECLIEEEESFLKQSELKLYVYSIFNLQRFFPEQRAARTEPGSLDQEKLDDLFLREICKMNEDSAFFGGEIPGKRLHEYLVKYVIMYFDNDYPGDISFEDLFQQFSRERLYEQKAAAGAVSLSQAFEVFGLSEAEYRKTSRKQLKRLFRKLAQKCHPDKGGGHDEFIALSEAYNVLLKNK